MRMRRRKRKRTRGEGLYCVIGSPRAHFCSSSEKQFERGLLWPADFRYISNDRIFMDYCVQCVN